MEQEKRPLRVLSIDGGGIRGIIPAMILSDLERRAGQPVAELFDLIVGTSTGSLLALALAFPDEGGEAKYAAKDVVRLYESDGPRVFSRSVWHQIRSVGSLAEGKYPATGIESVLAEAFGTMRLSQALLDVMVPAYEIERRTPFFFRSWGAKADPEQDFPMAQVVRAATAAPTYFEPAKLDLEGRDDYLAFVDGALFAYNPAMCAFVEALPRLSAYSGLVLVSLGTGELTRRLSYQIAREWGIARWAQPIFALMCDGICDVVDQQVRHLTEHQGSGNASYFRFQPTLDLGNDDMDDASPANLRVLKLLAQDLIYSERNKLRAVVDLLKQRSKQDGQVKISTNTDAPTPDMSIQEVKQEAVSAGLNLDQWLV